MTQRALLFVARGHCGYYRRHMAHRFWDPRTRDVYACMGWERPPVGFQGTRRDPADVPQARRALEAPLTSTP